MLSMCPQDAAVLRAELRRLHDLICEESRAAHRFLGPGHLESVYENALANRLRRQALVVEQQFPMQVFDEDGAWLGSFAADLLVENLLLVELKSCAAIRPEHRARIAGYLRAARLEYGLLINFGGPRLEVRANF